MVSTTPDGLITTWKRRDWLHAAGLFGFIVALHVVSFGLLIGVVAPQHHQLGGTVFGVGLGITAYTYGLRHAFDVDHIAAIDNTTRKLRADGHRPKSVGFWFAMGHAAIVFVLAALVGAGAHAVGSLLTEQSALRQTLGVVGTMSSALFLYLIGILNLVALIGIGRVFWRMRRGELDVDGLEEHLQSRGFLARMLAPITRAIKHPVQMFGIGLLFGLGFDTATEVALLVLAGSGAATGLPWYAIMVLPLMFASGMSLLDCLDGVLMSVAYDWAFLHPARKIYYNLTITGLSVAVALLIGTIEVVTVLHDKLGWHNTVVDAISAISLDNVGFLIVGLFAVVWLIAVAYWKIARVEDRWA